MTLMVLLFLAFSPKAQAQIKTHSDYIEKLQELRTLSQKMGMYYLMEQLFKTHPEYKQKKEEAIQQFEDILVELMDNAPDEELGMELQKLNLTWIYVQNLLKKPYERAAAGRLLDKLEDMQKEILDIIKLYLKSTKEKQAQLVEIAADTRVQLQRMLLYFIAKRTRVFNKEIDNRFDDAKTKLQEELAFLDKSPYNDEDTRLILDMIKSQIKQIKNLKIDSKINPITTVILAERLDEDLKMLVKTYRMSVR